MKGKLMAGILLPMMATNVMAGSLTSDITNLVEQTKESFYQDSLQEQQLMHQYLSNQGQMSPAQIELEKEYLNLERLMFDEQTRRWWARFSERQRVKKIKEYWNNFFKGKKYAASIASTSPALNSCKILTLTYNGLEKESIMMQSYARGFKAYKPECYMGDMLGPLKKLDNSLSEVKNLIFNVEKKVRLYRPTSLELLDLEETIEQELKNGIHTYSTVALSQFKTAFNISPKDKAKVQESVEFIKNRIDCNNLTTRFGNKFNCNVVFSKSPFEMTWQDFLKASLEKNLAYSNVYVEQINFLGLIQAVEYYLTDVNPNDELLRYFIQDLEISVKGISDKMEAKVNSAIVSSNNKFHKFLRRFQFTHHSHWRSFFPIAQTDEVVSFFNSLKNSIESFSKWDLYSSEQLGILSAITSEFNKELEKASKVYLDLQLPSMSFSLEFTDSEGIMFMMPMNTPVFKGVYFMGPTATDANYWLNSLAIEGRE